MPQLNLTKGHGCGVDVLVIDAAPATVADDAHALELLVRRLCERRGPIGAEAVYFVDGGPGGGAAGPEVWCFGPHGVAARGCAYGLGVVARILLDRHGIDNVVLRLGDEQFPVNRSDDSPEGAKRVAVQASAIRGDTSWSYVGEIVPAFHERRPVTSVAVPEPQLVSIVGRYDEGELIEAGRRVAAAVVRDDADDEFPGRPDVTFLMPLDEDGEVFARTYEYGIGVVRSSAAGVAAARAVYSELGVVEPEASVLVRTPGGPVRATLRVVGGNGGAWISVLEANATLMYTATLDSELLASPDPIALDLRANVDEVMAYAALRSANARALEAAGVTYSAP